VELLPFLTKLDLEVLSCSAPNSGPENAWSFHPLADLAAPHSLVLAVETLSEVPSAEQPHADAARDLSELSTNMQPLGAPQQDSGLPTTDNREDDEMGTLRGEEAVIAAPKPSHGDCIASILRHAGNRGGAG
jgi:hypothetical protein